ncbi:hypothetical protein [Pseudopedobacter beijingensis]|uniref:Uncharacterized protein n=1 Tax=Pseudopedobacter beijingensis TaxID=1207056 RepID=A0ABW4I962_9SPHI
MHQVEGKYLDKYFYLNADQPFNYSTWQAPIHWTGIVNGKQVEFTQIHNHASDLICFDWSDFPDELEIAKTYIVKEIDRAMRVMD